MKGMHPVDSLIQVERIPSELVRNLMDLLVGLVFRVGVVRGGFSRLEGAMSGRRQDTVEPGLLVLVARRGEGGARQLFSVQAVWRFLG